MLRIFIPTSNGKISRRRYIFSFILINFIFAFLIIFFNDGEAGFLVIVSTIGNDSNLLIVFYVQIMPDDFVMQLHR
ncbi:hypothetical protein P2R91_19350, partial [Escherichia coli]